jgi:hypothetical protein
LGRKLDTVVIEFPIPNITTYLASLSSYRISNTPKNIFMASSIVTVSSNTNFRELPINSHWFVESFALKRNVQRRTYVGTLSLKRWYGSLPSA